MTKISPEDVQKVASLARLDLPENKLEIYATQLENILDYVAQLEKVDTSNVLPTARAVEVVNVVREDEVELNESRDNLLELAPNREGDFYRVPKILTE